MTITLYIGTYTQRESFVDGRGEGIYIYRLDAATGELVYQATATGTGTINPSYLTLSPDRRCLYAVNEITQGSGPNGTVSAFAINPATGNLSLLNQQPTHGFSPCHLTIEPEGRFCLAANYESGSLCVLPVLSDRRLGEATDIVQFSGSGPNRIRQAGPHAHMVLKAPGSDLFLAADLGADRLRAFRLDRERGRLLPADPPWTQLMPGSGPRHLVFHPSREFVYLVNELQSSVTDPGRQGEAEFDVLQTLPTLPGDFKGHNLGAAIKIAPSGRFLYVSNRGHDSLAIYAVDPASGVLSIVGHESARGKAPRDFTIDPSGGLLLAANQDSDAVVSFWIDRDSGKLTPTGHAAEIPTPACLVILQESD